MVVTKAPFGSLGGESFGKKKGRRVKRRKDSLPT